MNNKFIFIIVIVLVVVVAGTLYFLNKPQQSLPTSVIGTTLNGVLVKKEWEKSSESYCAQGSDYFTLKTNNEELVLEFEPVYSEAQMAMFSGKNVAITGEKKLKKIECPEGSQCPATSDGVFTCEVFKVNKISESGSVTAETYKFNVNLQQCHHSYGVDGTKFGITTVITNTGSIVAPPATVWLFYDNRICDKKNLDKSYLPNDALFKNYSDGRWFTCSVELPPVPKDAEKINKVFKLVFTTGNQDPIKEGVLMFSGSTKSSCGVAVE